VLTAGGGLTGSFTLVPVQGSGATYTSTLSYDANNVYLEIDLAKLSPLLPSGATENQVAAIGGVDAAIAAGSALPSTFQNLGNGSSATLATDATQLAGEIGADVPQVSKSLFSPFMDAIFDHIGDGQQDAAARRNARDFGHDIWLSGFAGTSIVGGDADMAGTHKLKSDVAGFAGGGDWRMSPSLDLGAAISFGSASFHLADDLGTGTADAVQAAVYGHLQFNPVLYGSFAAALGVDNVSTHRVITVSGTDTLTGKFNATVYGGRYETGATLGWGTPYAALQDTLFAVPSYQETESSGAFALDYGSHTTNVADLEIGVRQSGDLVRTRNWTLRLSDKLAWSHALSESWDARAAFAALPSSDFDIQGASPGRDAALISLGAEAKNRFGLDLNLRLDSTIAANAQTYTGFAGLNISW
jgi:uncharacterized protein with beta-barrel porin domain